MDKDQLQQFLRREEEKGIVALHAKGYAWYRSEWMPRLRLAEELLPNQTGLLADCWYLVGDLCDFNGAPLQAIQAYQQALSYDEDVDGAYRELAYLYELTGQYPEALEQVKEALERLPDAADCSIEPEELDEIREDLLDLQASIQDSINYAVEPYLTPQNEVWQLSELLAQEAFKAVIQQVEATEDPSSALLQRLAQAQGALGEAVAYQATWARIAQQNDGIELGYADWFYLPEAVTQQPAFWQQLEQLAPRVELLELTGQDSLEAAYGDAYGVTTLTKAIAQYYYYQSTNDRDGLSRLKAAFPKWTSL